MKLYLMLSDATLVVLANEVVDATLVVAADEVVDAVLVADPLDEVVDGHAYGTSR